MGKIEWLTHSGTQIAKTCIDASMGDGVRLMGYRYDSSRPVLGNDLVCLPPVSGNITQFDDFALAALTQSNAPARIFTFDLRGRGLSINVPSNGISYPRDAEDVISFCDALGLHNFDLLASGTAAFTALLTMPKRPGSIRRFILNDGAPLLDGVGIARAKAAGQSANTPSSWDQAVRTLQELKGPEFPAFTSHNWMQLARTQWLEKDGIPAACHDKALALDLASTDFDGEQPDLWPEWAIVAHRPVLLIRGEHSSMVTPDIEAQLKTRHKGLVVEIAHGQGHVPLLHLDGLAEKMTTFLATGGE